MSDEQAEEPAAETVVTVTDEIEAAATCEGMIVIPVADLPAGSTVTVTITVGPSPAAPAEAPPAEPKRYINRS